MKGLFPHGTSGPPDDRVPPASKTTPASSTTPPEDDRIIPLSNPPEDDSSPPPSNRIRTEDDRTTPSPDWIYTDEESNGIPTDDDSDGIYTDGDSDGIMPHENNRIVPQDNEVKNVNTSAGACTQNNTSGIPPQVNNMFDADSVNITDGIFIQNNTFGDPLDKLKHVSTAGIHALSEDGCMEGTRVSFLNDLWQWSMDVTTPPIFWLDGMAGTGKSAIARSFCRFLDDEQRLGGSFFCLHGDESRATVKRILPTLACFLARRDSQYRKSLLEILQNVPDVADYTVALQVKFLLEKPLRCVFVNQQRPPLVLTIDALDECHDTDGVEQLLNKLLSVSKDLPVKFFLTSRPEPHIIARFKLSQSDFHRIVRLHDIEKDVVEADISLYLDKKLIDIRSSCPSMFPSEWPTQEDIKILTRLSGKLFIYAFTAIKYIESKNPVKRLQTLTGLTTDAGQPFYGSLDKMYSLVLSGALDPTESTLEEICMTKRILGSIISIREPLQLFGLARLLMVAPGDIWANTDRIRAVVNVPPIGEDGVVSAFHASFVDFLTTSGRAPQNMRITSSTAHRDLANGCLKIMNSELHFNIAGCKTSYLLNFEQTPVAIPAPLKYASLHWAHHIGSAEDTTSLLPDLENVLYEKFLFWLEVLSVSGMGSWASSIVSKALETATRCRSENLATFLYDANHFAFVFRAVINSSVPHIYLSALPSVHKTSKIAEVFMPKYRSLIRITAEGIPQQRTPLGELRGHTSFVDSVSFFPDGTRIVSGSSDNTIRIWDVKTAEEVMEPLKGHTSFVASVSFSPDGNHLVSGSGDKTIRIWDARTGKDMKRLEGHSSAVVSVRFSQDGTRIVSGSSDRMIRIWNATTGKEVMKPLEGHMSSVTSVGFSPDGTHIVSGSQDNTIRTWDAETGKRMKRLVGHASPVNCVEFSPDGTHIVSGSLDKTIRIWNATTGKEVMKPLEGHMSGVTSVGFSPDGTHIVSGSQDNTIRIWDARTGEVMKLLAGHTDRVTSVGFSPDGTHIVSGSWDQAIQIWEARTDGEVMKPLRGHTRTVTSVGFSPDGTRIVSSSEDKTIGIWDATTGDEVKRFEGHDVTSVRFSPDGAHIVSDLLYYWEEIRIWDARTGKDATKPHTGYTNITSMGSSPNGTRIVLGSSNGTIRISVWDVRRGEEVITPLTKLRGYTYVTFSPDGTHIAGSFDGTIRIWNARTDEEVMVLRGDRTVSLGFSPDGTHIVSGSKNGKIQIWDVRSGESVIKPLMGHFDAVSVCFSPDATRIVSGFGDGTIRIWDVRTGTEIFTGSSPDFTSVCFSPDGTHIMSGTNRIWDVRAGKEVVLWGDRNVSLGFSPDGTHIVSGSSDKMIRIWDLRTGEEVMEPLTGHTDGVTSVGFSPDGKHIVSGSRDKAIRIWDVRAGTEVIKPLKGHDSSAIPSNTGSTEMPGKTEPDLSFQPDLCFGSVSPDGWIRGPHQELILWVLPEWRNFVQLSSCVLTIGQRAAHFDLRNYVHGLEWIRCVSDS